MCTYACLCISAFIIHVLCVKVWFARPVSVWKQILKCCLILIWNERYGNLPLTFNVEKLSCLNVYYCPADFDLWCPCHDQWPPQVDAGIVSTLSMRKKPHTSDVLICPFAFANKRLLDRDGSKRHHIAPVRSVASVSLFFRMTNYSWRVSWFWPQLNLCAWTPPFLSPAQPTACCTTSRKWTLAPWNGTERAHALLSSLCVLSHKQRNCPSLFCFVFEIKALKLWRKTVSE